MLSEESAKLKPLYNCTAWNMCGVAQKMQMLNIVRFIFNAFVNLEPVQRSEDGCDMRRFRSFNHSMCKTVLNLLEAVCLSLGRL